MLGLLGLNPITQHDIEAMQMDFFEDIYRLKPSLNANTYPILLDHAFQVFPPAIIKAKMFNLRGAWCHRESVAPQALTPQNFASVRVRNKHLAFNKRNATRAIPEVFECNAYGIVVGFNIRTKIIDVCPDLSHTNVAGDGESAPNIVNTKTSDRSHYDGRNQHEQRPSGHIPLGYKVAFGAFVFMSGVYHTNNAFRLGNRVKPEAGALYLICGMALVFLGMGIFFSSFLT